MIPYLGNPNYTILSPSGMTLTVPVDDMFVMKQLNPLDPFMRGLGIAESIADEVEIDEYAAKFQKDFSTTMPHRLLCFLCLTLQMNREMLLWHDGTKNTKG